MFGTVAVARSLFLVEQVGDEMAEQRGREDETRGASSGSEDFVGTTQDSPGTTEGVPAGRAHSPLCNVGEPITQEALSPPTRASEKRKLKLEANDHAYVGCAPGTQGSEAPVTEQRKKLGRFDGSSLGRLAQGFLHLVSVAPNGTLDLNEVSIKLGAPKRRVYDITNVLQGIKLIQKTSKSRIQWLSGPLPTQLNKDFSALFEEESKLDKLIQSSTMNVYKLFEDLCEQKYAYLTHEDVRKIPSFKDQTVLVIKAPAETKLEVPHPEESLQVHLSSTQGPIDVFVCSDDSASGEAGQLLSPVGNKCVQPSSSVPQTPSRVFPEKSSDGSSNMRAKPTQHPSPATVTPVVTSDLPSTESPSKDHPSSEILPEGGILSTWAKEEDNTDLSSSMDSDTLPQDAHLSQ